MEQKFKICHRCGKPKKLWRSNPPTCKECDDIIKAQARGSVQKSSTKKPSKKSLNEFFLAESFNIPANCMNCNKRLLAFNTFAKRCVTAHILPKSENEFPILADDENNIFFLGAAIIPGSCTCHDDWDRKGVENRKKMNIYDFAVNQFNQYLRHKLNDHDFVKACDYLGIEWTS